jgi:uncharacterized protein
LVKEFVENAYAVSPSTRIWHTHINSVVRNSEFLANKLGVDVEVCILAAYLHDISKIEGNRKMHHVTGAIRARDILRSFNYDEDKIKIIEGAILAHSSDKNYVPVSIEQKILACADSLAFFDDFLLFVYGLKSKGLSNLEIKDIVTEKLVVAWGKVSLIEEAISMAKPKFEAINLLLGL